MYYSNAILVSTQDDINFISDVQNHDQPAIWGNIIEYYALLFIDNRY